MPVLYVYLQNSQSLTDTVRQKHAEYVQKQQVDPAFKAEIEAELVENFDKSDENKDGVLSLSEFNNFMRNITDKFIERTGGAVQPTEKDNELTWNATNTLTPGVDGISLADYKLSRVIYKQLMMEIVAQNN